jgi:parallel beta-helix repeat protein
MSSHPSISKVTVFVFFILIVSASIIAVAASFGSAQAATSVIGILTVDTTWTKAGSPYTLSGPAKVEEGITLTVEPGVTVDLSSYYLQVVGTLSAKGTADEPIHFIGGPSSGSPLTITDGSVGYDEATGKGCILENVVTSCKVTCGNSTLVNKCTLNDIIILESSDYQQPTTVSNCKINSRIAVSRGGAIIVNNTITTKDVNDAAVGISYMVGSTVTILSNSIIGGGISVGGGKVTISDNVITNCKGSGIAGSWGRATIEYNIISNNAIGISIPFQSTMTIQRNTIKNNPVGIRISQLTPLINYNNIENCSQNTIYLDESLSIDATNNWWGTTDTQAINQSIRDSKNDFNLGTINFVPFLTAPYSNAMPRANPPPLPTPEPTQHMPTPTENPNPTQTSSQLATISPAPTSPSSAQPSANPTSTSGSPELGIYTVALAILAATVVVLSILVALLWKKTTKLQTSKE